MLFMVLRMSRIFCFSLLFAFFQSTSLLPYTSHREAQDVLRELKEMDDDEQNAYQGEDDDDDNDVNGNTRSKSSDEIEKDRQQRLQETKEKEAKLNQARDAVKQASIGMLIAKPLKSSLYQVVLYFQQCIIHG